MMMDSQARTTNKNIAASATRSRVVRKAILLRVVVECMSLQVGRVEWQEVIDSDEAQSME